MRRAIFIAAIGSLFGAALASGTVITGTIVDDATGAPLAKCEVSVLGQRPGTARSFDSAGKDDGSFQTEDLKPGEYTVAVGRLGYVYTSMSVQIGGDAGPPLLIRLVRLGAIEGHLTGLQGWTSRVKALSRSVDKTTGKEIWKPVLDEILRPYSVANDGNFRISDLPPGTYALLVAYSNSGILRYPDGKGGLELKGDGATVKVSIPIPVGGAVRTIEGQIELPDSHDWYWVTLSSPDQPALAVATTMTDDKGAFAFRGIVSGAYELLASPGQLERGTPPIETPPYHGFARTNVDLREHDARDVMVKPQLSIPASVALQEWLAVPRAEAQCGYFGSVTLMPLEDWGVRMARRQGPFQISNDGVALVPQSFGGLAPARYGLSVENSGCLVADHPVLDLTHVSSGSMEAKVRERGTVRGHADADVELILIPEDFAEGWSYLPAMWFLEEPFGAMRYFEQQVIYGVNGPQFLPHVRRALADDDGHFEFRYVPAGMYRISVRAAGPAADWQGMKQVEITAAGLAQVDLATPKAPTSGQ